VVRLTEKEAVGVYLLLQNRAALLDGAMSRLRKRLEDSLLEQLTVGDFEELESLYGRLPDGSPAES
jgi:hypothetical protein